MSPTTPDAPALLLVDVQQGFDAYAEHRNNPGAEANIARVLAAWRDAGWPVVRVRHDSTTPGSVLAPDHPGNQLKSEVAGTVDLEVSKSVHSCFHGDVDLEGWLHDRGIRSLAIVGCQTNMCCETTARIGSDLGFDVWFVLDATWTFHQRDPDGGRIDADTLSRVTGSTLAADFCEVLTTDEAIARIGADSTA